MNINIELQPLERTDLARIRRWRNDWRVIAWSRQFDMLNEVEHERWFEKQATDPSLRMYKIVMKAGGTTEPVGVCGLSSLDWRNRRGEFSIYIGPEFHRKGLGRNALSVLLLHGFQNLGLNLIWGETFDGNPAAKLFESVGFKKEGTRRQFYLKEGKMIDAHLYSITAEEWHERRTSKPESQPADPVGGPVAAEPPVAGGTIDVVPIDRPGASAGEDGARGAKPANRGPRRRRALEAGAGGGKA